MEKSYNNLDTQMEPMIKFMANDFNNQRMINDFLSYDRTLPIETVYTNMGADYNKTINGNAYLDTINWYINNKATLTAMGLQPDVDFDKLVSFKQTLDQSLQPGSDQYMNQFTNYLDNTYGK